MSAWLVAVDMAGRFMGERIDLLDRYGVVDDTGRHVVTFMRARDTWRIANVSAHDFDVFVGAFRVAPSQRMVLRDGDVVRFRGATAVFHAPRTSTLSGVRGCGRYVAFGELRRDRVYHALALDQVDASGAPLIYTAWFNEQMPIVDAPHAPRKLAQVEDGVILEAIPGIELRALVDALATRGDLVAPPIVVAAAIAALECGAAGTLPCAGDAWLTWEGRVLTLGGRCFDLPAVWRGDVVLRCAQLLGHPWDTSAFSMSRPEIARAARARLTPAFGALMQPLADPLDVVANTGPLDDALHALRALADIVGPAEPAFVAAVIADVFAQEQRHDRDVVEQALVLGPKGLLETLYA